MAYYSSHVFKIFKLTLTYTYTFTDETKEKREEPYDPLFLPLTKLGSKTRGQPFLCIVGQVLSLGWLKYKTFEDVNAIVALLLPSLACRCIDNNDLLSLQEILVTMDINAGDYDGNTVMHRACEKGRTDMVKYLLSIGAACQLINRFGCTPLHLAIRNKHFDVIKILIVEGATVSLNPVRVGMGLIKAVLTKDCQLLQAWYLAGANMNQGDYNGQTALHAAVEKRDKNLVSKLLEYGATPENRNMWGRTAEDEARQKNLHDIVVLFNQLYFF
ncbi:L-asparaginase isoform X1 [Sinocyclocheilus grahami]|uniref:L-asparaginase isoform X1 n=1 Tax=Sinocyclocheilus grahami TaxID=75366 RepID=UPI0007ACF6CF|nr:PREDICTED: L-asparaginase-like isoform X1 [Sinocyclocheilus grahami]